MKHFILLFNLLVFPFIIKAQLSVTVNHTDPSCNGFCTGTATAVVTGGQPPYNYAWSNASIGINTGGLCAGVWSLTVTDFNSATITTTFTVGQPTPLSVFTNVINHASCSNSCDGAFAIMASGGTPPYSYAVTPGGMMGSVANFLCPGSYTVNVIDASGCMVATAVQIYSLGNGPINGIVITDSVYNETCLASGDGAIDINISGTNPGPFTYAWNIGATTQDISNLVSNLYSVTIYDASNNCETRTYQLAATGTNCGTISGNIFIDNNTDCLHNAGDNSYSNTFVLLNPGNRYGYTNANGDYIVNNLPYGTYSVSLPTNNPYLLPSCTTTLITTLGASNPNQSNMDFSGSFSSSAYPDVKVILWSSNITPGFSGNVTGMFFNQNNVPASGQLKLLLPSAFTPNISSVNPSGYTMNGDTIIWNYSNITYGSSYQNFTVIFTTPVNTVLGSIFNSCAYASVTLPDLNFSDNAACVQRIVTGSYDPNDKAVSPAGVGLNHEIHAYETDLDYLIRFQNTGNGPAVNIVVLDTLSANLDLSSLQMLGASHLYSLDILPGNILKWKFNNIMLPDSNSNEPGSHGYIHYKIKHTVGNNPGAQIKNTAYIYFDFNSPVVTNTTLNTIEFVTGLNSSSVRINSWTAFPNPGNGILYLQSQDDRTGQDIIKVYDMIGQQVYAGVLESGKHTIDLTSLPAGMYTVQLTSEKGSATGKIMIQK